MKLFLLRYDEATYCDTEGFVIRAENEEQARAIAIEDASKADLGGGGWADEEGPHDPSKITCVEVSVDGEAGVILRADVGS